MKHTYCLMDDKKLRHSILETEKDLDEMEMLYRADEIRDMGNIENAKEHGKGYEYKDHSLFFK